MNYLQWLDSRFFDHSLLDSLGARYDFINPLQF